MSVIDTFKKAKETQAAKSAKPKPSVYTLKQWLAPKICLYGSTASGKTFFLTGPLLHGDRVFVLSTDFGANGLITIQNELERLGREDLLDNIRALDLNDYEQIEEFLANPASFDPTFWDFDPTLLVWEGFSNFNSNILDEYILKHEPGAANSGELRHAGFTHTTQDWQGMQRGTMRPLGRFMALQNASNTMGKLLTCHERGSLDVNELDNNKAKKTVLVQGGARKIMPGAFDVIMSAYSEEDKQGNVKYFYRCIGDTSKHEVKSRGYNLKAIEPAEPERIYGVIKKKGGLGETKKK